MRVTDQAKQWVLSHLVGVDTTDTDNFSVKMFSSSVFSRSYKLSEIINNCRVDREVSSDYAVVYEEGLVVFGDVIMLGGFSSDYVCIFNNDELFAWDFVKLDFSSVSDRVS